MLYVYVYMPCTVNACVRVTRRYIPLRIKLAGNGREGFSKFSRPTCFRMLKVSGGKRDGCEFICADRESCRYIYDHHLRSNALPPTPATPSKTPPTPSSIVSSVFYRLLLRLPSSPPPSCNERPRRGTTVDKSLPRKQ